MSTITPTVGRVVWYYPETLDRVDERSGKGSPYPAIITHVWGNEVVNLQVLNDGSYPLKADALNPTSVGMNDGVNLSGRSWSWMPFQKGQAPASDAVKQAIKSLAACEHKDVQEQINTLLGA